MTTFEKFGFDFEINAGLFTLEERNFFFFFPSNAQRKSRDVEYINAKLRAVKGEETLFFFCFRGSSAFLLLLFLPLPDFGSI